MKHVNDSKISRWLAYGIVSIFLLLPIHTVFTTWAGANFGHIDLFRIWKELVLAPIALGALYLVFKDEKLRSKIEHNKLVALICLYILLHLIFGVISLWNGQVNKSALLFSWLINLRFLVFFLVCWLVATKSKLLRDNWKRLVLIPAVLVIVFGLMQQFVLPNNFLTHLGYGPNTIPAIHTVDQKPEYMRLQSTLRGPNPLGAYLVVIISLLGVYFVTDKKRLRKTSIAVMLAGIVLFYSYSRSAWLGLAGSLFVALLLLSKDRQTRKKIILVSLAGLLLTGLGVGILQSNSVVSNTVFHTDSTSKSLDSSNEVRAEALGHGLSSVIEQPFGRGPGTAGPASFRNDQPPRISENYYLQIAQEVGLAGLVLFVLVNLSVARLLWVRRGEILPVVLLATLFGLTLVNMLSHAWADDVLSYLWWGLAGLALANSHPKIREKTK